MADQQPQAKWWERISAAVSARLSLREDVDPQDLAGYAATREAERNGTPAPLAATKLPELSDLTAEKPNGLLAFFKKAVLAFQAFDQQSGEQVEAAGQRVGNGVFEVTGALGAAVRERDMQPVDDLIAKHAPGIDEALNHVTRFLNTPLQESAQNALHAAQAFDKRSGEAVEQLGDTVKTALSEHAYTAAGAATGVALTTLTGVGLMATHTLPQLPQLTLPTGAHLNDSALVINADIGKHLAPWEQPQAKPAHSDKETIAYASERLNELETIAEGDRLEREAHHLIPTSTREDKTAAAPTPKAVNKAVNVVYMQEHAGFGSGECDPGLVKAVYEYAPKFNVRPEDLIAISRPESTCGTDPAAYDNPNSRGAEGDFQFIASTWNDVTKHLSGTGESWPLADRFDHEKSAQAAAYLWSENRGALQAAGISNPSPGAIYMMHQEGSVELVVAALQGSNAPASAFIPAENVQNNWPFVSNPTAAQFVGYYANAINSAVGWQGPPIAYDPIVTVEKTQTATNLIVHTQTPGHQQTITIGAPKKAPDIHSKLEEPKKPSEVVTPDAPVASPTQPTPEPSVAPVAPATSTPTAPQAASSTPQAAPATAPAEKTPPEPKAAPAVPLPVPSVPLPSGTVERQSAEPAVQAIPAKEAAADWQDQLTGTREGGLPYASPGSEKTALTSEAKVPLEADRGGVNWQDRLVASRPDGTQVGVGRD